MRGVSRASFAELSERLSAEHLTSATVATGLANELFAVTGLLDAEHGLRRALSDPGKPAAEKGAVVAALLHGKVTARAEGLVAAAAEAHWASSGDLADAIEQLAVEAMVLAAETEDGLDDLEDGLFRFGRAVVGQPGPAGRAGRSVAARRRQVKAAATPCWTARDPGDARPDRPYGVATVRVGAPLHPSPWTCAPRVAARRR